MGNNVNPFLEAEEIAAEVIENGKEAVEKVQTALVLTNELVENVKSVRMSAQEVNLQMNKIDAMVDMYCANLTQNLEKYKARAEITGRQIDGINAEIRKLSDKVISLDIKDPAQFEAQGRLLDTIGKLSDNMMALVFSLM